MYSCAAHWTQGPCIPVLHTGHKGHVFLCCTLDTRAMYSCAAHWTQGPCIHVLHTGHKGHVFMLRCGVFLFVIAQSSMIVGKLWYAHAICSGILCECVWCVCVCAHVCANCGYTHIMHVRSNTRIKMRMCTYLCITFWYWGLLFASYCILCRSLHPFTFQMFMCFPTDMLITC